MSETKHSSEEHESVDPTPASEDVVARANDALAEADAAADAATSTTAGDERPAFAVSSDGTADTAPAADSDASPVQPAAAPRGHDRAAAPVEEDASDEPAAPADEPKPEPFRGTEPEPTEAERRAAAVAAAAMDDDDDTPWYDRPEVAAATGSLPDAVRGDDEAPEDRTADAVDDAPLAQPAAVEDEAPTTPLAPPTAPPVTEAATAPAATSAVLGAPSQSTVFVQAPEEPRRRGNRGFSGVVALLATIVFAAVYLAALLVSKGTEAFASGDALGTAALAQLTGFELWTPVVAFFLGFWLLGAFLNTAKWGYWVVFGVFVGLIALAGHVLGGIFAGGGVFQFTGAEAYEFAKASVFSLPGFAAFVMGRELPVWFGGWIARRGRKVIAANIASQEEYERTLEAGPQLADE